MFLLSLKLVVVYLQAEDIATYISYPAKQLLYKAVSIHSYCVIV